MGKNKAVVLHDAAKESLELLRKAGFPIDVDIEFKVDNALPYMGHTMRKGSGHAVVVSGNALKSPMLYGLLLHELSHVRRNIEKHPSHDNALLDSLFAHILLARSENTGIVQALHTAVNHIQDLYADDIVFRVIRRNPIITLGVLESFFTEWAIDAPSESRGRKKARENGAMLLRNSFTVSNMERHGLNASEALVKAGRFLQRSGLSDDDFAYFRRYMTNMAENPTAKRFEKDMIAYLERFLHTIGE